MKRKKKNQGAAVSKLWLKSWVSQGCLPRPLAAAPLRRQDLSPSPGHTAAVRDPTGLGCAAAALAEPGLRCPARNSRKDRRRAEPRPAGGPRAAASRSYPVPRPVGRPAAQAAGASQCKRASARVSFQARRAALTSPRPLRSLPPWDSPSPSSGSSKTSFSPSPAAPDVAFAIAGAREGRG